MVQEASFSYEEMKESHKFTAVIVDSRKATESFGEGEPKDVWRFNLYNRVTDKYIPVRLNVSNSIRGTMFEVLGALNKHGITAPKGAPPEWYNGWEITVQQEQRSFNSNPYTVYLPTGKVGKVADAEYLDLAARLEARRLEAKAQEDGAEGRGVNGGISTALDGDTIASLVPLYTGRTEAEVTVALRKLPAGSFPIQVLAAVANGEAAVQLMDIGAITIDDQGRFAQVQ